MNIVTYMYVLNYNHLTRTELSLILETLTQSSLEVKSVPSTHKKKVGTYPLPSRNTTTHMPSLVIQRMTTKFLQCRYAQLTINLVHNNCPFFEHHEVSYRYELVTSTSIGALSIGALFVEFMLICRPFLPVPFRPRPIFLPFCPDENDPPECT